MIRSDKNIDRLRLSLLGKSIHPVQTAVQLSQLRLLSAPAPDGYRK